MPPIRNLNQMGRLMRESHPSLRDLYQVSCRELDIMVEEAGRDCPAYTADE